MMYVKMMHALHLCRNDARKNYICVSNTQYGKVRYLLGPTIAWTSCNGFAFSNLQPITLSRETHNKFLSIQFLSCVMKNSLAWSPSNLNIDWFFHSISWKKRTYPTKYVGGQSGNTGCIGTLSVSLTKPPHSLKSRHSLGFVSMTISLSPQPSQWLLVLPKYIAAYNCMGLCLCTSFFHLHLVGKHQESWTELNVMRRCWLCYWQIILGTFGFIKRALLISYFRELPRSTWSHIFTINNAMSTVSSG